MYKFTDRIKQKIYPESDYEKLELAYVSLLTRLVRDLKAVRDQRMIVDDPSYVHGRFRAIVRMTGEVFEGGWYYIKVKVYLETGLDIDDAEGFYISILGPYKSDMLYIEKIG